MSGVCCYTTTLGVKAIEMINTIFAPPDANKGAKMDIELIRRIIAFVFFLFA